VLKPCLVAIAAFLTLAPAASAQPKVGRGTHTLSAHVSPDFESAIGDMLVADVGYGFFVRDRLALRASLGYVVMEDIAGEDEDYRMQEAFVAAEYHLGPWGVTAPYLGAGVGWTRSHFADLVESGLTYGPTAGVEVFLADNVALELGVTYRLSSAPVFVNDFVAEDSDLTSAVGLRLFF
jgi:outer membrane protein W